MATELLVRLSGEDLSNAILIANKISTPIEEALSTALKEKLKNLNKEEVKMKKNEQSSLMNAALHNAFMLEKGAEFSIIDLLGDQWDRVESPRAFGRSFRQALESSGLASVSHKTSDNKTIYKREEDKQNSMFIKAT